MNNVLRCVVLLAMAMAVPGRASAQWENPSRAFHKNAVFQLEGRHLTVPCADCHINGQIKGTPTTCFDCHWVRRQDDVYRTRLGTACEQCHRPTSWTATRWDHGAATGMPLNPAHRTMGCEGCHKNAQFAGTSIQCIACHRREYDATRTPNHVAAGFSTACDGCHKPSDVTFMQAHFTHSTFPLTGQHATQTCETCHKNGQYAGTPSTCLGCHKTDYDRTANPSHAAAGFSTSCDTCHKAADPSWHGATLNHNQFFPLVGQHATQACATCHKNGLYKGTPTSCLGCHKTDYDKTTAPNHASSGISTTCEGCHRAADPTWVQGSGFNHNAYFPLVGLHATQACASCHKNSQYPGTPTTCIGCHSSDYNKTSTPNHAASGFSTSCDSCHKATDPSWMTATFNHNSFFPLVGLHATQTCTSCHKNGQYPGTPTTCIGCHSTEYNKTSTPNHAASGFSTSCESCHKATDPSWMTATFNHNSFFPLVGLHATQTCAACHANGVYKGTPTDCYTCHRAKYDQTTNPKHAAAGFPTSCVTCHNATDANWNLGRFTHTGFPITSGRHSGNPCSACHTDPNNYGTFTCLTCHTKTQTDSQHKGRSGYQYNSNFCYSCHPTGRAGLVLGWEPRR